MTITYPLVTIGLVASLLLRPLTSHGISI